MLNIELTCEKLEMVHMPKLIFLYFGVETNRCYGNQSYKRACYVLLWIVEMVAMATVTWWLLSHKFH